jgi:hypothetical protein
MRDFPSSANDIRELAVRLIVFLKEKIKNTFGQQQWSDQNFQFLHEFFGKGQGGLGLDCRSNGAEGEFLWDFTAYIKERGLLLVAEPEWDNCEQGGKFPELEKDFDKLLYARSPLKLFMCRIENPEHAERIRARLQANTKENCAYYSSGEVFIIYCVWWAEENGKNRDIAYLLQVKDEPKYQRIDGEDFKIVAS